MPAVNAARVACVAPAPSASKTIWRKLIDSDDIKHAALSSSRSSISVDVSRAETEKSIVELLNLDKQQDWDGDGVQSVSRDAVVQALIFLQLIPKSLPEPEVTAHPDGEVGLTWAFGRRKVLSVAIAPSGKVSFASLVGYRSLNGKEYIVGKLPQSIALALQQVLA